MSRAVAGTALAAALIAGMTACASPTSGPTVVLRAVTPDAAGEPAAVQLEHFADEVERISAGALRIEPGYLAAGRDTPRFDQVTAGMVVSGEAELGWIPARTWDTESVTSLRALNTPFLIEDDGLFEAVLSDAGLRDRLMSGLPAAGVVGIDLFAEGMRRPFGFDSPLLGAGDYVGEVVRAPESETVWATLESFGATPVQVAPDASTQRGMESSYESALAPFATGNVTLFPKANVLVAGVDVRARLTDAQWDVLARAAEATRQWTFDARPSEVEAALAFCARGGTIAQASRAQRESLIESAKSVVEELHKDAATRGLIEEIAALGRGGGEPGGLESCPGRSVPAGEGEVPVTGTRLNGTYTFEATEAELRAAGISAAEVLRDGVGSFTVAIDYPRFHVHHESPRFRPEPDWSGTLTLTDGVARFQWTAAAEDWSSARVVVADEGALLFADHRDGSPDAEWLRLDRVWFDRWERLSDSTDPPGQG